MTRKDYQRRAGALRKLMRQLQPVEPHTTVLNGRNTGRLVEYCFGVVHDQATGMHHIYNYNSNNCIATIRFVDGQAVIRYRQRSFYSGVICAFNYTIPTTHVPSTHLSARSRWMREVLRGVVQRAYRTARASENPQNASVRPLSAMERHQGYYRDGQGRLRNRNGRYVAERPRVRSPRAVMQEMTLAYSQASQSVLSDSDIRRATQMLNEANYQTVELAPMEFSPYDPRMGQSRARPLTEVLDDEPELPF